MGLGGSTRRMVAAVNNQARRVLDSVLLGVVGALSAQLFIFMLDLVGSLTLSGIAGYHPPRLLSDGGTLNEVIGPHGLWLVPVVTTLGGLLSGLLVYSIAPEAEGHGTDTAVKAFHRSGGSIRARIAPLKLVASAITIGTGGSAGREGPTALISAGVGSLYATISKRPDEERRLLVLIGMAAGLSAIFRSPIGTAIFAVEVLYRNMEFDAPALVYTLLASVVAYAVNGLIVGWSPLFRVPDNLAPPLFSDYLWYGVLGLVAGLLAVLVPTVFYRIRDGFRTIPLPNYVKPALGGLGVGLLALLLPQVLGGGYGWIQLAIEGRLALGLMLALVFAKLLALALTVSSGGSGGVFAPSLFVGAMLGGALARLIGQPPTAFAIVGMAALFAGAARVPIASMLMVSEMTGGYSQLVAAGLAVTVSYFVQGTLASKLRYPSLYEAQVRRPADSPAHHREQVENALYLLQQRLVTLPRGVPHLRLADLLDSGVPVDLPDGNRLTLNVLSTKSPWPGHTLADWQPACGGVTVIAVFRGGGTCMPRPELVLRADDRLLAIVAQDRWEALKDQLLPLRRA
jgi:CIC family chloride channel protein